MKIIKFSTEFCGSCRKLDAILEVANLAPDEEITLSPDDLDIARRYNVSSFPTLIKLDNEENEIERINGLVPLSKIKEFFGT